MKKIMIASDIHGSAYYCRQLLERYKEEKAERLILLGDILYGYVMPDYVIKEKLIV